MRAAVVIGVDQVGGGLPRLQAAARGAAEVADWLSRSDYRVSLFTDRDGAVERSSVFREIAKLVDAGTVERLVVYFAGHGFLKGPVDEYWLLSGAPVDASEAVNVIASANMARYRGIPEVVFISDACRVAPVSGVHSSIAGASIFPNVAPSQKTAAIDFFYATRPGDPALERSGGDAERAHGLFTQELLQAHRDAPEEALLTIGNQDYVSNDWLRRVLADRVIARAEGISLCLTQSPDVQIQIRDGFIARNEGPEVGVDRQQQDIGAISTTEFVKSADWPRREPVRSVPRDRRRELPVVGSERVVNKRGRAVQAEHWIVGEAATASNQFKQRRRILQETASQYATEPSYDPVLSCVGDVLTEVVGSPGLEFLNHNRVGPDVARFRLDDHASQVAVRFADGSGMLLPVLRSFSCEVVRYEGRTLAVNYTWLPYHEPGVVELRAEVLGAATLGLLDQSRQAAAELARRLRHLKRFDPTLGLVSALAYVLAGDREGARSVRLYMRRDLGIDLFDAWMLGGGDDREVPVVPALPLLSQSWSLLDLFSAPISEELRRLARVPGFWTVFEPSAMDRIMLLVGEQPKGDDNG